MMPEGCFTSEALELLRKKGTAICPFCKQQSLKYGDPIALGDLFECSICGFTSMDYELTTRTGDDLANEYKQSLERSVQLHKKALESAQVRLIKYKK